MVSWSAPTRQMWVRFLRRLPICIGMKQIAIILGLMFALSAFGQTNVINISKSHVTINNYYVIQTNVVAMPSTNAVEKPKMVVLPPEVVERLKWEAMLEERRVVMFRRQLYSRFP